jgi:hypothetical protein
MDNEENNNEVEKLNTSGLEEQNSSKDLNTKDNTSSIILNKVKNEGNEQRITSEYKSLEDNNIKRSKVEPESQ